MWRLSPIWIEGPHLFKKDKYYYLMCAEGGTGGWHSEVILRAKNPTGPWEECPNNPILTQRTGLDPNRRDPVSSAGHADIVEDGKGNWWAVFLACRPYEEDMYNTGRDTYLLPVTWKNGWPEILAKNTPIATVGEKAGLKPNGQNLYSGNFEYTDNFENTKSGSLVITDKKGNKSEHEITINQNGIDTNRWMFLRDPVDCYKVENGKLTLNLLPGNIYKREPMSAIWARQQHGTFTAETFAQLHASQRQGHRRLGTSPEGRPQLCAWQDDEEWQADAHPDSCREEQRDHRLHPYQGWRVAPQGRRSRSLL